MRLRVMSRSAAPRDSKGVLSPKSLRCHRRGGSVVAPFLGAW